MKRFFTPYWLEKELKLSLKRSEDINPGLNENINPGLNENIDPRLYENIDPRLLQLQNNPENETQETRLFIEGPE